MSFKFEQTQILKSYKAKRTNIGTNSVGLESKIETLKDIFNYRQVELKPDIKTLEEGKSGHFQQNVVAEETTKALVLDHITRWIVKKDKIRLSTENT